jgi:hypothetical protein
LVGKRCFDSGAVGLGGTAAETLDEDTLHIFILRCHVGRPPHKRIP